MRPPARRGALLLAVALGASALLGASDADAVANPMLQDLMKRLDGYVRAGDMKPAAEVLRIVSVVGPDEYKNWSTIADKARAAAASGDVVAAKVACTSCHDQYRSQYKNKFGSGAGKDEPPTDE